MQKAQDLHIRHLYVIGEDQDSVASSSDVLPEITVNGRNFMRRERVVQK